MCSFFFFDAVSVIDTAYAKHSRGSHIRRRRNSRTTV